MFLACERGRVAGRLSDAPGEPLWPVQVVPFLGRSVLLLELVGHRGRRYWTVTRGDIPDQHYRELLTSAQGPAREPDNRAR